MLAKCNSEFLPVSAPLYNQRASQVGTQALQEQFISWTDLPSSIEYLELFGLRITSSGPSKTCDRVTQETRIIKSISFDC